MEHKTLTGVTVVYGEDGCIEFREETQEDYVKRKMGFNPLYLSAPAASVG